MKIPVFTICAGKPRLSEAFRELNDWLEADLDDETVFLFKAKQVLYWDDLKKWVISKEFVDDRLKALKHAFNWAKHKFQDRERNNWGNYFEHQLRVAYSILEKSKTPTLKKLLIALHHDSIEDTNITHEWLAENFEEHVSLWVAALSKKPFTSFIKDHQQNPASLTENDLNRLKDLWIFSEDSDYLSEEYLEKKYNSPETLTDEDKRLENLWLNSLTDTEKFEIVESAWVLNSKWLLSDKYLRNKRFNPEKITLEEKFAEELYKKLEKKYKPVRDNEYFSHMISWNWECINEDFEELLVYLIILIIYIIYFIIMKDILK